MAAVDEYAEKVARLARLEARLDVAQETLARAEADLDALETAVQSTLGVGVSHLEGEYKRETERLEERLRELSASLDELERDSKAV